LLVSLLTAAYGAWPFDLVLLLVPIVHLAVALAATGRARTVGLAVATYVTFNGLGVFLIAASVEYFWFLWMTPVVLIAYLLLLPVAREAVPPGQEPERCDSLA